MTPEQIAKASERGWHVYDVCGTLFVLSDRNHELIEPGNVLQLDFKRYSYGGKIIIRRNPYIWAKIMDHLRGYNIFPIDDETAANAMLSLSDFLKYLHDDARAYGMPGLAQRTVEQFTLLENDKPLQPSNPYDPLPRRASSAYFYDGNSADLYASTPSAEEPLSAPLSAPFDYTSGNMQSAPADTHGSTHACARPQPAHMATQPRSSVVHTLVSTAPVGQSSSTTARGQNLQATPRAPTTHASAEAALGGTQAGVQVPSRLVNSPGDQAGNAVPGSSIDNAQAHGGPAHEHPTHNSTGTPLYSTTARHQSTAAVNDRSARSPTNGPPPQPVFNLTTQQLPENGADPIIVTDAGYAGPTPDLATNRRSSRQARSANNASGQQHETLHQREQDRQNRQQEVQCEFRLQNLELKYQYYRRKAAIAADAVKHAVQLQRDILMEHQRQRSGRA